MSELKFKYLNEIDISDSLTGSAHVIVEDGGSIKRAPMNQLVVEGGVSSWNDLEDKPFSEEGSGAVIEWNGNTEGMGKGVLIESVYTVYKISDTIISRDEIIGATMGYINPETGGYVEEVITEEMVSTIEDVMSFKNCLFLGQVLFAYDTNVSITGDSDYNLPGTGVWATTYFRKLTYSSTTIHTLDEKFIPDTIARSASSHGLTVSDAAGETVTSAEFNALLVALREAGYLAT